MNACRLFLLEFDSMEWVLEVSVYLTLRTCLKLVIKQKGTCSNKDWKSEFNGP